MSRKNTPKASETEVLILSRRRCAICYGISREYDQKSGQIAHLDKDNTNSAIDNLCFLCFHHHDEYDSKSSQRKNFTIHEVKKFREELYRKNDSVFSESGYLGHKEQKLDSSSFEGDFSRINNGKNDAEISLMRISTKNGVSRYMLMGIAFARINNQYGPNVGNLVIMLDHSDDATLWAHETIPNKETPHKVVVRMYSDGFDLIEENFAGIYGMGVTFNGRYVRSAAK